MKRLNQSLVKVLKIKEEAIRDDLRPADVPSWDSMNALILVSELERSFHIHFSYSEVRAVTCVGDIKKALINHGVVLE